MGLLPKKRAWNVMKAAANMTKIAHGDREAEKDPRADDIFAAQFDCGTGLRHVFPHTTDPDWNLYSRYRSTIRKKWLVPVAAFQRGIMQSGSTEIMERTKCFNEILGVLGALFFSILLPETVVLDESHGCSTPEHEPLCEWTVLSSVLGTMAAIQLTFLSVWNIWYLHMLDQREYAYALDRKAWLLIGLPLLLMFGCIFWSSVVMTLRMFAQESIRIMALEAAIGARSNEEGAGSDASSYENDGDFRPLASDFGSFVWVSIYMCIAWVVSSFLMVGYCIHDLHRQRLERDWDDRYETLKPGFLAADAAGTVPESPAANDSGEKAPDVGAGRDDLQLQILKELQKTNRSIETLVQVLSKSEGGEAQKSID